MCILTGEQIGREGIVYPFIDHKVDDGVVPSYGCDGGLYTLRISETLPGDRNKVRIMPLKSLIYKTFETIAMPPTCEAFLTLKSTYSRHGLILVTNSPVDPGYRGRLTVRLFNSNDSAPIIVAFNGGVMQMIVHRLEEQTAMQYEGRWQDAG